MLINCYKFLRKEFLFILPGNFLINLILFSMLSVFSATSQVTANFTALNSNVGCGSLIVEFEDLSTGNPDTWNWDFGNGMTSNLPNPIIMYTNPGIFTVKLTVSDNNHSDSYIITDYIIIHDLPNSDFSESINIICQYDKVVFTDQSNSFANIVDWIWDFGDGGSSNLQNPIYYYPNDGIYNVSLLVRDDNGCENILVATNLIEVKQIPAADFSSDIKISCDSVQSINFINNSSNANDFTWIFGDGNFSFDNEPVHLYTAGVFDVVLIANNGICLDSFEVSNYIEVGANVLTEFSVDADSNCKNVELNFIDLTHSVIDSWNWDFGDGTFSNLKNPSHNYVNSGTYSVSLTTSINGECLSSIEYIDYIHIFPDPFVDFDTDSSSSCIVPFEVNFYNSTPNVQSLMWIFSNGDTSALFNPAIEFAEYGKYDVSLLLVDSNGCTNDSTYVDYVIVDDLVVDFHFSDSIVCINQSVQFSDNSNSLFPLVSYSWSFGDGNYSSIHSPNHQYVLPSIYNISLRVENSIGCIRQIDYPSLIRVIDISNVDFIASDTLVCAGEVISFDDATVSIDSLTFWEWNFGDGNSDNNQDTYHEYNEVGLYTVSLISGIGSCIDTLVKNQLIQVIEPSAYFETETNCLDPYTFEFQNFSLGADSVLWNFGDGSTSNDINPVHTYLNRGTYDVLLRVKNNLTACIHEYEYELIVSVPEANFTYLINANNSEKDSVICVGSKRSYIDNLSQDCRNYKVDWGDGYIGFNRQDHLYSLPGTYDVTLMMTDFNGCKDTLVISNMFRVSDIEADFAVVDTEGCDSLIVNFTDLCSEPADLFWDLGNNNFSYQNNPHNIYLDEGQYNIILYAVSADGCKDTLEKSVDFKFSYPEINFEISDVIICPDQLVSFIDSSIGYNLSYEWSFGDGSYSLLKNPSHIYSNEGSYTVKLIVKDSMNCISVDSNSVILVKKPTANFTSSNFTSSCPPLISSFTNNSSSNLSIFYWDFGDGIYSTQENPSHVYSTSGIYDVSLIVEDQNGCRDTMIYYDLIQINGPIGDFTISETQICADDTLYFNSNVLNTSFYFWDFGDGIFSTDSNPFHIYSYDDYFVPKLIIENDYGCQFVIHYDDSIKVKLLDLDAGINDTVCLGDEIILSANGYGNNFLWDTSIFISNPSLQNVYVRPTFSSMFFVSNTDGECFSRDSVYVHVHQNVPNPSMIYENHCYNDTMVLYADAGISGSFLYEWNISGNSFSDSIVHYIFDSAGSFIVQIAVVNLENFCSVNLVDTLIVDDLPHVDFSYSEACFGDTTYFNNLSSSNVVANIWSFGDHFSSSFEFNSNNVFSESGFFNTTLVSYSDDGCSNSITKEVLIYDLPKVKFSANEVCVGDSMVFTPIIDLENGYVTSWNWDFGDNTIISDIDSPYHIYLSEGFFEVNLKVESNFGCKSKFTDSVLINPVPDLDFIYEFQCIGDIIRFQDRSLISNSEVFSYTWDFGDGVVTNFPNTSHLYKESGIYNVSLSVITLNSCFASIEKQVEIFPLPIIDFLWDDKVCLNEEVDFSAICKNYAEIDYNWDFSSDLEKEGDQVSNIYDNPGIYSVSLSAETSNSCVSSISKFDIIQIEVNPEAEFLISNSNVSMFDPKVSLVNNSSNSIVSKWFLDDQFISSDDSLLIEFNYPDVYSITLYVEDINGCSDEFNYDLEVSPELIVYIPNSFTPNEDNINDYFTVSINEYSSYEMHVYNRWGEVVFYSDNIDLPWNGSSKGNDVLNGTYYYTVSITDLRNKLFVYKGEVNVMR